MRIGLLFILLHLSAHSADFETGFLTGIPTLEISFLSHENSKRPPVVFIHGYKEGKWIFERHYMEYFHSNGFNVFAVDLRGHGGSGLLKNIHWLKFSDYRDDVSRAISWVENKTGQTPILVGHSMGGVLVMDALETKSFPAAIVLSAGDPKGMGEGVAWLFKNYPLSASLASLTLNQEILFQKDEYAREFFWPESIPLDQDKQTIIDRFQAQPDSRRMVNDMFLLKLGPKLGDTPVLFLSGKQDLAAPFKSLEMASQTFNGEIIQIQGLGHDILMSETWSEPAKQITDWLESQLKETANDIQ